MRPLSSDLRELIRLLNTEGVEYPNRPQDATKIAPTVPCSKERGQAEVIRSRRGIGGRGCAPQPRPKQDHATFLPLNRESIPRIHSRGEP